MNAHAITLAARQNAFHDLGRVSLPTPAGSDVSEAYTRSASAYVPKLTIPTTKGNEALQAGGTRKKRDRLNRPWRPGGRGERIEHREQEREQLERRRQEREQQDQQQGTRTVSKTQPLLSPSSVLGKAGQAGGGYALERNASEHSAHDAEPCQEQRSAPQALVGARHSHRCSSTENTANLAPSFPAPAGLPLLPPSNPLASRRLVPERGQWERFGSASSLATVELQRGQGGHAQTTRAKLGVAVPASVFRFWLFFRIGGLAS